jgi:hypothetical protein
VQRERELGFGRAGTTAKDLSGEKFIAFEKNLAIRKAIDKAYESVQQSSMSEMLTEITADANVEVLEGDSESAGVDVFELKESADEAPVVWLYVLPRLVAAKKGIQGIWKDLPTPAMDLSEVGWSK